MNTRSLVSRIFTHLFVRVHPRIFDVPDTTRPFEKAPFHNLNSRNNIHNARIPFFSKFWQLFPEADSVFFGFSGSVGGDGSGAAD